VAPSSVACSGDGDKSGADHGHPTEPGVCRRKDARERADWRVIDGSPDRAEPEDRPQLDRFRNGADDRGAARGIGGKTD
jgi:hypothetical protein